MTAAVPDTSAAVPITGPPTDADLAVTATFDHDNPTVRRFALEAIGDAAAVTDQAARLFRAVRDRLWYDPWTLSQDPADYTASVIAASTAGWCVPKAILMVAASRAVGIPARIGFADVRNHLASGRLREAMGSDLFVWHGYAALHVEGAWRKVSPAFNAELCERFGVPPLEFDGTSDALLHAYDGQGRRHMEYVNDRGTWTDMPREQMWAAFREQYGDDAPILRARRSSAAEEGDQVFAS